MAVFGLPRAHEDDALRAVRAAIGMQSVLLEVNVDLEARFGVTLANRTGVNTGEVVTTDDPNANQKMVTGDAVNLAARLEQAAPKNEILIGDSTYRLVKDAVEVAAVEPLTLKGKAQPVPAFKLLKVHGFDGNTRRHDAVFVGREGEVTALQQALQAAIAERKPRLVTIVGDAGLGKTRLVKEIIERSGREADSLAGRCLPYGDGITFWPLRDMIVAAAGIRQDDTPEVAVERVRERVGDDEVTERLAAAAGFSARAFPLHEIYWGARRFLQTMARERPLVALFDDIHWAEPAFLDLLENLVESLDDAPVLLLATARPELLEERTDWCERERAMRLVLQPLDDSAAAQVVTNLLGASGLPKAMLERVVQAAEGNPLYVEQMLGMLIDNGIVRREGDAWVCVQPDAALAVPPTINALLEARLDRLGRAERSTAEPASVMGLEFRGDAVASLVPDALRGEVDKQFNALTRKQFIRPTGSASDVVVFRFHHHLVRETVYNGLLKRNRANLHIAFVKWADTINAGSDRAQEYEAILGYHLEQAYRYLGELGPIDEAAAQLGQDGARRLANAGQRALARGDMHAAANLMQRAVGMLPADDRQRAELLPEIGEALTVLGDFGGARKFAAMAREFGQGRADPLIDAAGELVEMQVSLYDGGDRAAVMRRAQELIPTLQAANAHAQLALAWRFVVVVEGIAGHYRASSAAAQEAISHARIASNARLIARLGGNLSMNAVYGATPVADAVAQCEQLLAEGIVDRQVEAQVMLRLGLLYAMNEDNLRARGMYRQARALLRDLGEGVNTAASGIDVALIELLCGDLASAEKTVLADLDFLRGAGESYYLSTMAALLSKLVREQGRDEDALRWSALAEEVSAPDDVDSQSLWRSIRAPILARRGDHQLAESMAREAYEMVRDTEALVMQADALSELADVLLLSGREAEAFDTLDRAAVLYEAKGDRVSLRRAQMKKGPL
jgi:tetratricopeptide (TPR) repeat protein/type II secretory pathway predicted ATPase ExeA